MFPNVRSGDGACAAIADADCAEGRTNGGELEYRIAECEAGKFLH